MADKSRKKKDEEESVAPTDEPADDDAFEFVEQDEAQEQTGDDVGSGEEAGDDADEGSLSDRLRRGKAHEPEDDSDVDFGIREINPRLAEDSEAAGTEDGLARRMTAVAKQDDEAEDSEEQTPAEPDETDAGRKPDEAPLAPDSDTKDLLKKLKQQQKLRLQQEMVEAQEMERKAKDLAKKVREQQKVSADVKKHAEYVKRLAPQLGFDPDRPITVVPPLEDPNLSQVDFTTIQPGRSYIRLVFDQSHNRYVYEAIEPGLTSTEAEVLEFIRDTLVRTLDGRRGGDEEEDWEDYLNEEVERVILDHSILIDEVSKQRIQYYIVRDFLGYGRIDVLMRDPMIEDISCDGPDVPIYIFHREYESIRTNVVYDNHEELDSFVIRLAQRSGKHISIAEPILDATLPDTSRLQATLAKEVTTRGSSFTIRKFRSDPLTPPDLVRFGSLSSEMAAYYWLAMEEGHSLILAGGTASGKTTLLNAIANFIPPDKKIVSIEDTREVNLMHENWIAGLTRSGFGGEVIDGKQAGAIDMYKLLEAALRQRPEYLLVGEVRGPEALTLFQAMATGHATYSTMHADSVRSAVYRLENKPISVPRIMLQTLDIVGIQLQVRVNKKMVRRMREVVEIIGIDPDSGDLLTNTVFRWSPSDDKFTFLGNSHIFQKIMEKKNLTHEEVTLEWRNRTKILDWMIEKGIRNINDVARVVSQYYRTPDKLMQTIKSGTFAFEDEEAADDGAGGVDTDAAEEATEETQVEEGSQDESEETVSAS